MANKEERGFRFLDDRPVETTEEDIFGVHSAYAQALFHTIQACPTPFAIGLYGTWGSGKTTIINLLRPLVEQVGHRWIYLDVWKYSRDPVRRWILAQTEEQLGLKDYEFEERTLQSHLEFEEELETKAHPFEFIPRVPKGWRKPSLVALFAVIGLAVWLFTSGKIVPGSIITSLSGTAFILQILANWAVGQKIRHIRSLPAVSPEKFGAIFSDMAQKALGKDAQRKLVIIFDNLDRCPEDAAVDTLSAIKTFLDVPGCVYLVPCDEEALTTHILRSYGSYQEGMGAASVEATEFAREFLRKFFQLTLRLPEVLEVDYDRFVAAQVESANADQLLGQRVQDVALIAYERETPRKIKRFINDFLGYFILAQSLEASGELEPSAVTGHVEFLAKMVVIFQEWPQQIEKIKANPEILREVTDALRRGADLPTDYQADEPLVRFLRATQDIEPPDNVLPFVYFKRAEHERDPKLVAGVTKVLAEGDGVGLSELARSAPAGRAEHTFRIAVDKLRYWTTGDRLQASNATRALLKARAEAPERVRADVAAALWLSLHGVIQREALEGLIEKFDVGEVLSFSEQLQPWQRDLLVDTYVRAFEPPVEVQDFHLPLLSTLVEKPALLTTGQRNGLREHLKNRYEQAEEANLPLIEAVGRSLSDAGLISSDVPAAISANFSVQADELNRSRAEAYVQIFPSAPESARQEFTTKLVAALAPSRAAGLDPENEFALDLLERLGADGFHHSQAEAFGSNLTQQIQQTPVPQRARWIAAYLALDEVASNHRGPILNLVAATIKDPNASQVAQCLNGLSDDNRARLLTLSEVREALKEQVPVYESQHGANAKALRKSILVLLPWQRLAKILPDIVDNTHDWDVEAAFEMIVAAFKQKELTPYRFGRLAIQLLDRFVRGSVVQHSGALRELAEVIADNPIIAKQERLAGLVVDLSVELLKQEHVPGGECLLHLAPVVEADLKRRVAEELLDDLLAVEMRGGQLDPYSTYVEVIGAYEEAFSEDTYGKAHNLIRRGLGPGKRDADAQLALDLLNRLTGFKPPRDVQAELKRLSDHEELGELARDLLGRK